MYDCVTHLKEKKQNKGLTDKDLHNLWSQSLTFAIHQESLKILLELMRCSGLETEKIRKPRLVF